jgi:hypothetical protein
VLAVGLVMLVVGVLLIVLAVHRRRTPAAPYGQLPYVSGVPVPPGPPPSWNPPAPVDRTTAADARNEAPTTAPPPGPPQP